MIKYENTAKFLQWILEKTGRTLDEIDFNAYLDDVDYQHGCTGSTHYELASCETVSRLPEVYNYDYDFELDEDDNFIGRKYIF